MKILHSCGILFTTVFAGLFFSVLSFSAHATVFDFSSADHQFGAFNMSMGGIALHVDGGTFAQNGGDVTMGGVEIVTTPDGIGILTGHENLQIDGNVENEMALFYFSQTVTLESVTFRSFKGNDNFTLFVDDENDGSLQVQGYMLDSPGNTHTFTASFTSNHFGIGARGSNDEFTIKSLSVSAVPLPPSLLLFTGALLGIGWVARRGKLQSPC